MQPYTVPKKFDVPVYFIFMQGYVRVRKNRRADLTLEICFPFRPGAFSFENRKNFCLLASSDEGHLLTLPDYNQASLELGRTTHFLPLFPHPTYGFFSFFPGAEMKNEPPLKHLWCNQGVEELPWDEWARRKANI